MKQERSSEGLIEDLRELTSQGWSNAEIGEKFGKRAGAVKSLIHRLTTKGIVFPPRRNVIDRQQLVQILNSGTTVEVAAQYFSVTRVHVLAVRRELISEGFLPTPADTLKNRDATIAQLSQEGLTDKEIVTALWSDDPPFDANVKQVQHVRAKLIKQGVIRRHPRGGFFRRRRS